jgi:hypothetical protein
MARCSVRAPVQAIRVPSDPVKIVAKPVGHERLPRTRRGFGSQVGKHVEAVKKMPDACERRPHRLEIL